MVWGYGKEGQATLDFLCVRTQPGSLAVIDENAAPERLGFTRLNGRLVYFTRDPQEALLGADVLVKSPGISKYRAELAAARAAGVHLTSSLNLWYPLVADATIVGITGTNGKSTTATLLHRMLVHLGINAGLVGNMGIAPLATVLEGPLAELWVGEFSSYQTADLNWTPDIGVLLNLYPDHYQWHGGTEQYFRDKCSMLPRDGIVITNALDPEAKRRTATYSTVIYFEEQSGFHSSGGWIMHARERLVHQQDLALRGGHNLTNVCAALSVVRALQLDWRATLPAVRAFAGLPHRLQTIGRFGGLTAVDDSICVTPEACMAALRSLPNERVCVLLGGADRRQDYSALAHCLCLNDVHSAVTMYETGPRIAACVHQAKTRLGRGPRLREAASLEEAVHQAASLLQGDGVPDLDKNNVILLSPAAPSHDAFTSFEDRGEAFHNALAGLNNR